MIDLEIGVILPSVAVQQREALRIPAAARYAEGAGLDGVWHGDHLAVGVATLDCAIALAAAATATERVRVGASVLIPAIRPIAWAAKQIASLQHLSQGRLVLGVGSGGGPDQWAAAGVPYEQRGRRTDTALELLPRLLAGGPVQLVDEQGQPEVALDAAVTRPPFWVGNASAAAIRRAARLGDGWFPSVVPAADVLSGAGRLGELCVELGRRVPTIAVGATGALGNGAGLPTRDEIAARLSQAYEIPPDRATTIPITGSPDEAAERLAAYHAAGARHLVMGFAGGDWRRQCDLLAEARARLR
ncbi:MULTISPECIES: LLM class flavin-dependent oxidoreductase [unclassified Pseudofrankia]|uniref:LLM class flavin-dependent oxidoreductase n=1 Tax=unclassified Pseudofrankia TaxID=2994372 RepID=UPI000A77537E|nr:MULTISPECIES: LLM class flavin-dependent oxidoreductase [unclassified Pseudofrankia]MDT3438057.1 LLM class flavin-dependent oxidoreductase [Pseudofrankia sp. BMG5.37]